MKLIDKLIPKIIETINNRANISKLPQFSQVETSVISIINDIQKQILLYVEQIKDEIPVPHLSNILEDFIRTQEKNKNPLVQLVVFIQPYKGILLADPTWGLF